MDTGISVACLMEGAADSEDNSDQIPEKRKQGVPGGGPALAVKTPIGLAVVVIVVVPITIRAPAVAIFIPPAMAVFPTPFARFCQSMAILRGLRAVPTVMLSGFMELVIRAGDALLAVVVRAQRAGTREEKCSS